MSLKSSSSNGSHLLFSVNFTNACFNFNPGRSIFTIYTIVILLLVLPLCILVLHRGLQQWWKPGRMAATCHSDSFTYHMVIIELMNVFGASMYCASIYLNPFPLSGVWMTCYSFTWLGESFFHILLCLDLYLAAVHPVTYFSLRKRRWVMVRQVVIACIWLSCIIGTVLNRSGNTCFGAESGFVICCLVVICFCSLCVLRVLSRPGPGAQAGDMVKVDQSKLRAFYTIVVILGVLLLRVTWLLVWTVIELFNREVDDCMEFTCEIWINLPGTLVLPLLFLQKTGTLACWKSNRSE